MLRCSLQERIAGYYHAVQPGLGLCESCPGSGIVCSRTDSPGLVTIPSGEPLFLAPEAAPPAIPPVPDALPDLIREVGVDLLEVADRVRTSSRSARLP